jgi:hypothetical protein
VGAPSAEGVNRARPGDHPAGDRRPLRDEALLARVDAYLPARRRVEFDAIDFYHNEAQILGADTRKLGTVESAKLLAALVPDFESGQYRPPKVAATYPLAEGVAAYRAVAAGTSGHVVLTPWENASSSA